MTGVEIAIEIERRGINLYRRARKLANDPATLELLLRLETEETAHYEYFNNILKNETDPPSGADEAWTSLYAASLAAEGFYPGGLMQVAYDDAFASPLNLLDSAVNGEIESIEFYNKLKTGASGAYFTMLDHIILQEQSHLALLKEWREKATNKCD